MSRNKGKTNVPTVTEILGNIRQGDSDAIALLYRVLLKECYPKVNRYITNRLGGSEEDVEDWYQDVFLNLLKAIKAGKAFKSFGNICSYLMQGVKQQQYKASRRAQRPQALYQREEDRPELGYLESITKETLSEIAPPCKSILQDHFGAWKLGPADQSKVESKTSLWECLDGFLKLIQAKAFGTQPAEDVLRSLTEESLSELKGECGQLLRLYYREEKSLKEIAEILGYAYGTTKNKKGECIKELSEKIIEKML